MGYVRVVYEIDVNDRIVDHDGGWERFARENGAPALADPIDPPVLWDSIADETTRLLWRALVDHVRTAGTPLQVGYRCDAPHTRRWFEARLTLHADERVRFDARLVREEPREPVLDGRLPIDHDRLVRMCSWCARFACDDDWCEIEDALRHERWLEMGTQPLVTHTICPTCFDRQMSELDAESA